MNDFTSHVPTSLVPALRVGTPALDALRPVVKPRQVANETGSVTVMCSHAERGNKS